MPDGISAIAEYRGSLSATVSEQKEKNAHSIYTCWLVLLLIELILAKLYIAVF